MAVTTKTARRCALVEWAQDCMQWRGAVLTGAGAHWCWEWDGLPIDETCREWPCCHIAYRTMPRKMKKWACQGMPKRSPRLRRRFDRYEAQCWDRNNNVE